MCSSPLNILVALHWTCISTSTPFILWNPKLDTVLQMQFIKCRRIGGGGGKQGDIGHRNHFPWPAGYALANTAIGCPERLWSPSPSSEILETQTDMVLDDLLQVTLVEGGWTRWPPRGHFQPVIQSRMQVGHLCCKGTLLTLVQLVVHQNTQVFLQSCFLGSYLPFQRKYWLHFALPTVFQW